MNLAVLLLLAAAATPTDAAAEHARFIGLHREWQQIHETATRERISANAYLVLDPREEAVWIERDGKIDPQEVQGLPSGLDWSAFLVTPQGVAQIPFPVRFNRPRADVKDEDDPEEIWILGSGKDRSWQFSVSSGPARHELHVGSGSSISSITCTMPHGNAAARKDPLRDSILVYGSPKQRKWADTLRTPWFSVNVVRHAAAP